MKRQKISTEKNDNKNEWNSRMKNEIPAIKNFLDGLNNLM